MKTKTINIPKDFHPRPYGRDEGDGDYNGYTFCHTVLAPALKKYDAVHVDLTGYNRYGRSFLDEAFGGLIREEGFTAEDITNKLTYSHNQVQSIISVIDERIAAAIKSKSTSND